jgi:hypothetical protein
VGRDLKVKSDALTMLTPSEVRSLTEPFMEQTGGPIVRCYYCSRGGSTETIVLKDGQPVSGWVCVEHAAHPPRISCYYCAREDAAKTTVLKDGRPVSRWVCVEHAADPPKRAGGMRTRLRRIVHPGSRGGNSAQLPRRR